MDVFYTTKSYFIIFISDSIATDASVSQSPSGSASANLANDGRITSCSNTKGNNIQFQVDLNKESIVKGMYITFGGMLINNIYMQYNYNNIFCLHHGGISTRKLFINILFEASNFSNVPSNDYSNVFTYQSTLSVHIKLVYRYCLISSFKSKN